MYAPPPKPEISEWRAIGPWRDRTTSIVHGLILDLRLINNRGRPIEWQHWGSDLDAHARRCSSTVRTDALCRRGRVSQRGGNTCGQKEFHDVPAQLVDRMDQTKLCADRHPLSSSGHSANGVGPSKLSSVITSIRSCGMSCPTRSRHAQTSI